MSNNEAVRLTSWLFPFVIFGCVSADVGEAARSPALNVGVDSTSQIPAEQKSPLGAPKQTSGGELASPPPSPSSPAPTDDDEADADIVESGTMSDAQRTIMRGVGRCLERALRQGPGPGGSLAIGVTVDGDGNVTQVELGPGYPPSARSCTEARVKSVHFPKETNAGIRFYRYPVNELPANDSDP